MSKGLPAQGGAEPAAVLYRAYKEPPPPGRQVNRPASLARAGGPHRVGLYRSSPGLSSIRFCRLPRSHALRPPPLADAFEARWNSGQLLHLTSSSESCGSGECRMLSAFCIVSRLRVSVLAWGHICVWVGTFSFACVGEYVFSLPLRTIPSICCALTPRFVSRGQACVLEALRVYVCLSE